MDYDYRDIDRLVGKNVMMWDLKTIPGPGGGQELWIDEDGMIMGTHMDYTLSADPSSFWRPTENGNDARAVVARLKGEGFRFKITRTQVLKPDGHIELSEKNKWFSSFLKDDGNLYFAYAETPELAICFAALRVRGILEQTGI